MGKSCGQLDFFSLGGQYYSLGQSNVHIKSQAWNKIITKNDCMVCQASYQYTRHRSVSLVVQAAHSKSS